MHSLRRGFTLVELMIVVAIIGILATIAVPSYRNYMMRGDRSDGVAPLQAIIDAQERYFNDNNTFTSDLSDLGLPLTGGAYITPKEHYSITAGNCSGALLTQCVEITATALGEQAKDGDLIFNTRGKRVRSKSGVETEL
jgi:type IV pilus assembly protein PilE